MFEKYNPMGWEMHRGYCKIDIKYLLPKIAYNISHRTIQAKRFNRANYKKMIMKIVSMDMDKYTLKEIATEIKRSPERVRQLLAKFYRRLDYVCKKDTK